MNNKTEFYLRFEEGMPKATAQMKGECIRYKVSGTRRVPYIHHFKKAGVSATRREFELKLKAHRPKQKITGAVRLTLILYFDKKSPKKAWGTYKVTRPDCDNYAKELIDSMTAVGFWEDDAQIADLHIVKYYAEKATIFVRVEELET